MRTDRGVVLVFVCGALIGIFAALVQQREQRVRRPNALTVSAAVLTADAESGAAGTLRLAAPPGTLAELARISHPSFRRTDCDRDDPARALFNAVGAEIDPDGRLRVPVCAAPSRMPYAPDTSFPDGSRPMVIVDRAGNTTFGNCTARLPGWHESGQGIEDQRYLQDDNALTVWWNDLSTDSVQCRGYVSPDPQDHCTEPVDVIVAGFPLLQAVYTLAERALVYAIILRPRVPWRDAAELDSYVNVSAWGIPFDLQPDGTYYAYLLPDGHWSDTLGPTVLSAACPGFCRPYPLDIMLCTAECPCMPTTTTSTTTTTTTTTAPPPPLCTVVVRGGLARLASAMPPSVAGATVLYNDSILDLTENIAAGGITMNPAAASFRLVVQRNDDCVHLCMQTGLVQCSPLAGSYFGVLAMDSADYTDRKTITPRGYSAVPHWQENSMARANETAAGTVTFTHGLNEKFSLADCCFTATRNGVSLRTYYAQFVVFLTYTSIRPTYSYGKHPPIGQSAVIPGYIFTMTASLATRVTDQRNGQTAVPDAGLCVVAFSVLGAVPSGTRFSAWAARDDNESVVLSGVLDYDYLATSVLLLLPCNASLGDYAWTLVTTDAFPGTASAAGVFAGSVPAQPTCGESEQQDDRRFTQHGVLPGSVFDHGVAVRILSYSEEHACTPPDPLPADDATAFLFTAAGNPSTTPPCAPDAVCIDLR